MAAAWTAIVWVGRLVIMAGDDHSARFLAVHGALAGISLLLAVPVAAIGWRMWRGGRRPG